MLVLVVSTSRAHCASSSPGTIHPSVEKADRVIVKKEKRILVVLQADRVLYTFDIVLGGAPEGDKMVKIHIFHRP